MSSLVDIWVTGHERGWWRHDALVKLQERYQRLADATPPPAPPWNAAVARSALVAAIDHGELTPAEAAAEFRRRQAEHEEAALAHELGAAVLEQLLKQMEASANNLHLLRPAWEAALAEVAELRPALDPIVGRLRDAAAVGRAPKAAREAFGKLLTVFERYEAICTIRDAIHRAGEDGRDKWAYFRDLADPPHVAPGVRVVYPETAPRRGPDEPLERLVWLSGQPDACLPTVEERRQRWLALTQFAAEQPSPQGGLVLRAHTIRPY